MVIWKRAALYPSRHERGEQIVEHHGKIIVVRYTNNVSHNFSSNLFSDFIKVLKGPSFVTGYDADE